MLDPMTAHVEAISLPMPGARASEARRSPRALRGGVLLVHLLALGLLSASPAFAEGSAAAGTNSSLEQQVKDQLDRMPSGEEGVTQIMTELEGKLALSPEQDKDVREVVTDGVADLQKLRARFESGELTAMAFGVQVQMQMRKMGDLIDPLLDPDQQAKYKALRQEQRREMMKAMQKQRMEAAKTK